MPQRLSEEELFARNAAIEEAQELERALGPKAFGRQLCYSEDSNVCASVK
jgi:hypothetical protein